MLIASALLQFSNKIDINIKEGTFIFIYKLFDKRLLSLLSCKKALYRIQYPFFFFSKGEILKIARLTLCPRDFVLKARELFECMKQKGSKYGTTGTSLRKIILAHPESFEHFSVSCHHVRTS